MKLGINTYTYMWSIGFKFGDREAKPAQPLSALDLLGKAHELGVRVVQVGPNLPLDKLSEADLDTFIRQARAWGIELELGTLGLETDHLLRQLALAKRIGARLLRTIPEIGGKPIASVDPGDILGLLDKLIADGKIESARRVRQRLDAVFEYVGLKYKIMTNPVAIAKREINKRVRAASRTNPAKNYPCVPSSEAPQLLKAMRAYVGTPVTRSLMWFVAMTACRTGEARYATWDEFNFEDAIWTIPAKRMKARREHIVPLAKPVIALLTILKKVTGSKSFVFAHPRRDDRPASENAILFALAAMGYKDRMTGHGFRQMFSTMANESGLWRPDVIETSLAHAEDNAVRLAYNKAAYLDERRRLMNWWCEELARLEAGLPAKVVHMHQTAA